MLPDALDAVRMYMGLVDANIEAGHVKTAANELRKAQNVIRLAVLPELDELEEQLADKGPQRIVEKHPSLADIVDNIEEAETEVGLWLNRKD